MPDQTSTIGQKQRVPLRKQAQPDADYIEWNGGEEQYYHFLAEAIPQIVWTARPDGYNDYFNRRWFEYTGLSAEETYDPLNQGWPDFASLTGSSKSAVHEEDQAQYLQQWKEALRSGKSYEIEYRFRRAADGMYRWHLGRAVAIHDEEGNVIKWFGTCTDIHDQKEAQVQMANLNRELERSVIERTQELRLSQEQDRANLQRLHEIIQNLPMGALAIDEQGIILHANALLLRIFGIDGDPNALAGTPTDELRKHFMAQMVDPELFWGEGNRMLDRSKPLKGDLVLKDGRIIEHDYIPIVDKETERGFLLLYRDITQERRIDNSKSEFMSLASHQLRTPLTAIRWTFGRLQKKLADRTSSVEQRLIDEGRKAANRMAETIDTMLAISRIEAGKVKLDITPIDLPLLLHDVQRDFADDITLKHLHVSIECDDGIEMQTDEHFLREIIFNLVSNAVKYTPERGHIAIALREQQDTIVVTIEDTGYGIPTHQQEKIFSKFFRGDNVTQHDTTGTGLGLYLVYLLMRIMRGQIKFLSQEGKGTIFTLTFPRNFYELG